MSAATAWLLLLAAGLLEICWAVGLKFTEGFTRLVPSILVVVTFSISMYLLAKAAQVLPIGTAYAVWVGIGAAGAGILGVFLFKEPLTATRATLMLLLILSIVGLKVTAK